MLKFTSIEVKELILSKDLQEQELGWFIFDKLMPIAAKASTGKGPAKPRDPNKKTVPNLIIEAFANSDEKSLTLAEVAEATGLTTKQCGDTCWRLTQKGQMVKVEQGVYAMAEV